MNYSLAAYHDPAPTRPASSVKRLIRSVRSSEYFRGGQWTFDPKDADQFPDAGKVVEACIRYHLTDVELVLQLTTQPSGSFEMHLPLRDQPAAPAAA
jgi:hypothetical protein